MHLNSYLAGGLFFNTNQHSLVTMQNNGLKVWIKGSKRRKMNNNWFFMISVKLQSIIYCLLFTNLSLV